MFGIGTGEMLVWVGLVAIVWLALKGRAGAAMIVTAGLGLLTVLVVAGIFAGIFFSQSGRRVTPVAVESMQIAPDGTQYWVSDQIPQSGVEHSQWTPDGKQYWPGDSAYVPPVNVGNTTWFIAMRPALLVFAGVMIGIVLLFVKAASRGGAHSAAAGHGRIWPAFVALPILALLVIGGVRYESSSSGAAAARRAAEARESMLRDQRALVERQRQQIAQHVAAAKAKVHRQIEQMDIHALMDQFDAPRIVLQVPLTPSAGPGAIIMAAAASAAKDVADAPAASDTTATKENVGKNDKKKIALRSSADGDKHPAAVELKMESPADGKPGKMSIAVEAEAPQPPAAPVPPVPPVVAVVPAEELKPAVKVEPARLVKSGNAPPAWINDPPKRTGDVRREVIVTDPFATDDECYHAGDVALMFKVGDRIEQLSGRHLFDTKLPSVAQEYDHSFRLNAMGITREFLRRELVAKDPGSNESRECLETVTSSVGPMKKLYMQIEFTPAIDRELLQFAEAHSRQERFAAVGFGAGSVLTLLTMVWGLLKIDTATKGYYTKRLFLGVPLAIIAGVIAIITWMNYRL